MTRNIPLKWEFKIFLIPNEKIDTSFTLIFYNTEVLQPKIKFTVSNTLEVEEGKPVTFDVLCEAGNFPIEDILFSSNIPISGYKLVKHCDDNFSWTPPYDFVNENDRDKQRTVILSFIGSTRFKVRDTALVKAYCKRRIKLSLCRAGTCCGLK